MTHISLKEDSILKDIQLTKTIGKFSFSQNDLIGFGSYGKVYKGIDKLNK